ncbi:MAG TPA: malto-oligosyltrehalose trehalohydrolase [Desulfotomaculum sp.]|nr:MAG: Malto-oligosyltrehalose trehalohydrolase [Desulfotomaculum sp. 46_80]KUK85298.1 MAG: Malto-oligosyltrehalose trehalohydrolase [Desulfofundulus kuznetsovii]HAG10552.1 malto-oligosyltrehalose trehalohydrolase [Desulfotomaculum sp.]HBY03444.1 malto-oligosyltrehalose trehalohydrolase [Desulfotomaculum sp.]
MNCKLALGAYPVENQCFFNVWAPKADSVAVHLVSPADKFFPLIKGERGYYFGKITGVEHGSRYYFLLDKKTERPDPASRYQPEGVYGPSEVVNTFLHRWSDQNWPGPKKRDLILYELHVGTYTANGDLEALIPCLDRLIELGITAIELMPVGQFPGSRNWGYDVIYPYAVQNTYGGPESLQRLVDACHGKGLAVILDAVYNHFGPEGNYLGDFGYYFTERYHTPWGSAINFDGPGSDEVKRFYIENALMWINEFHIDGLRLDAIHAIDDKSAMPFLEEIAEVIHRQAERLGRRIYVFAESDLNDDRVIRPRTLSGFNLDAQWSDDFHHSLQTLVTGEHQGYYMDFGTMEHVARSFRTGYTYTGQYSPFRERRHGRTPVLPDASKFIVFAQNHDQAGNQGRGKRTGATVSFEALKLIAGVVILAPFLPLLFMGEEYGETAPFYFFTDYSDPILAEAVFKGRKKEISAEGEDGIPDPQDAATFFRSHLDHYLVRLERHSILFGFYRNLILLRKELPALNESNLQDQEIITFEKERLLFLRRWHGSSEVCTLFNFSGKSVTAGLPLPLAKWLCRLDSADKRWLGDGNTAPAILDSSGELNLCLPPWACILYEKANEDGI